MAAYADPSPFSFRMELSMNCPRCDHPVPVDGPVTEVTCPYCGNTLDIDRSWWAEQLAEAVHDMKNTPVGQGSGSMFLGTSQGNITLGRLDPYCDNCKTDFKDPWALKPGGYTCMECGSVWPVSRPPDWLENSVPGISLLINALVQEEGDSMGTSPDSPQSLSCPSCSGSLEISGESRIVRCRWCDRQIYLPDQVWINLHGRRQKRRWFVVCGKEDHPDR